MFIQKFYEHLFDPNTGVSVAVDLTKACVDADLGDATPHSVWKTLSPMPRADSMARTVFGALRGVFDRSGMEVSVRMEFSFDELDHALQDMSHALGTGQIRSRRNNSVILPSSFPVDWLYEPRIPEFVGKARTGSTGTC